MATTCSCSPMRVRSQATICRWPSYICTCPSCLNVAPASLTARWAGIAACGAACPSTQAPCIHSLMRHMPPKQLQLLHLLHATCSRCTTYQVLAACPAYNAHAATAAQQLETHDDSYILRVRPGCVVLPGCSCSCSSNQPLALGRGPSAYHNARQQHHTHASPQLLVSHALLHGQACRQ